MRTLGLIVAVALCITGCSFSADFGPLVENRCSSDADCPGATCDTTAGMCVATPDHTLHIVLAVTPAAELTGGTPTTHTLGPFEVDQAGKQDVTLLPSISVFGMIRGPGFEDGVPADIRVVRSAGDRLDAVPKPVREATTLTTPAAAADGRPANYGIRVLQDREYDVTITPTGSASAALPPLRTRILTPVGADFVRLDFELPADLVSVQGLIIDPDEVPVDDLQVQAVEIESGRVVSSTAITDMAGEFTIHVDPGAAPWVFRISGGPDATYPTLLADPSYFFPDMTGSVRILVPMLTDVFYEGRVFPEDVSLGTGVANAVLTFRSIDVFDDTTGVTSSYRTTATTDSSGRYSLRIFPGTYDVIVTPPAEVTVPGSETPVPSPLGIVIEEGLEIRLPTEGGELRGQGFELPTRPRVRGEVVTSDGRTVSGASIDATALARPGAVAAALYNRSASSTTDEAGAYDLRLDFGAYDLTVKPAPESGFSWLVAPGQRFAAPEVVHNFELAAPVPLTGRVDPADSAAPAVAGAEIRAWALVEEPEGGTRAVPVGRTTTRDDGTYMLLLPSRL